MDQTTPNNDQLDNDKNAKKKDPQEIISNIKKDIKPLIKDLEGKDPDLVYQTLKSVINKHIPQNEWDNIANSSTIVKVLMPEENPSEPWNKKNGGAIKGTLDDSLHAAANEIAKGKSKENGGAKQLRFSIPFTYNEKENLKEQGVSSKNYIREKIKTAVRQANIDPNELDKAQSCVNFKNFGSRSAPIKTTGHNLLEALTEVIYVSIAKEMNPDQVKNACEQNMGTSNNTGMEAGNMIDDMMNGTGDELEQTQEGFTFSAD